MKSELKFQSYEELVAYLREFDTWIPHAGGYDFVGMAHLFGACLDNLRTNATAEALNEQLPECLTAEQMEFLRRIANRSVEDEAS